MNIEEAKFVLAVLRPGIKDPDDPNLVEALKLAETEPELRDWLENQQGFDQVVSDKLAEIEAPSGLHSSLLAGARVVDIPGKKIRSRRSFALLAAVLAIAAMVLAVFKFDSDPNSLQLADFRDAAIEEINTLKKLDFRSADPSEIRKWLKSHSGDGDFETPAGLEKLATAGCHLFEWKGNQASLICFQTGSGEAKQMVHLVVLDGDVFSDLKKADLDVATGKKWATAVWRDDSRTYLLASRGGEAKVRRLIESG